MAQKLLVGDKDTVLLIPAFEIAGIPQAAAPGMAAQPITGITSAMLNAYLSAFTPGDTNAHWGGNVSCAILETWKLELAASTTKVTTTLCSVGNAAELTFYNYDAQFPFLDDANGQDATSPFNLPALLTDAPDIPYIIAHRVGYSHTAAAAAGQEWNFYYVWTDFQIATIADGDYLQIGETFVSKGIINFKAILGS